MYVLDTDHMTIFEWTQNQEAQRLRARLKAVPEDDVRPTIVNYEEQIGGWLDRARQAAKVAELVKVYARLRRHIENYRLIDILDFDEAAAVEYQRLCKQYRRIRRMDLRIAAIVLVRHATLLTRNKSDFGQIIGLSFEDWTKE
jgi:tRNA(fMet)-specific endonuclease VapC